ncbi:hypothetical protein GCM10018966_002890 [Streptomyces yanii]
MNITLNSMITGAAERTGAGDRLLAPAARRLDLPDANLHFIQAPGLPAIYRPVHEQRCSDTALL